MLGCMQRKLRLLFTVLGFCTILASSGCRHATQPAPPGTAAGSGPHSKPSGAPSLPQKKTSLHHTQTHNVAILIDTTTAMNGVDMTCHVTNLECVLAAARTLLANLVPCKPITPSCSGDKGIPSDPVDMVTVFTFPNVTVDSELHNYDCSSINPTVSQYVFPSPGALSYAPLPSAMRPDRLVTYQVVPFSNDYLEPGPDHALNPDSNLVRALGGKPGCPPMKAPGGMGTFYAGAIYAAQASLAAERAVRPGSLNVMIFVNDGFANSSRAQMDSTPGGATNLGVYPSWLNECSQGIAAAKSATAAGTRVYSVAYRAITHPCVTEISAPVDSLTTCSTMAGIASSDQYFYSAVTSAPQVGDCLSGDRSHNNPDLNAIFRQIAQSIRKHPSRLPK